MKNMKKIKTQEKINELLSKPNTKHLYKFTQYGATIVLQKWWRHTYKWRHIKFRGHIYCKRIQRCFRRYERIKHIKWFEKIKHEEEFREKSAINIQKLWKYKQYILEDIKLDIY